jgi:chloride channel protein, CIC family
MKKIRFDFFKNKNSLPVAPFLDPTLISVRIPIQKPAFNKHVVKISLLSILLGIISGLVAQVLTHLIGLITNLSFYGKFSTEFVSPANNHLGLFVIVVPILGAIIVGLMARYGSKGIRGHGIPEAMEQVILNESRIPPRLTFLKPISAAISIGTGGPFGAEGPIIATGGALGSLLGQILNTSADERKTLLAAGAAAGMAATFGSPISAILLSVELLLFEFRPQSLIPVALASTTATALRIFFVGTVPVFNMPNLQQPGSMALVSYLVMGALIGIAAVLVTRAVYKIEDLFEKLPVHWMWWPAIGAIAVGIIGYFVPHTLGVGYDNINNILNGTLFGKAMIILFIFKFISWSISLGSGTSGGTLAPLFTIGGGLGALLGSFGILLFPNIGIDVRIAALIGMAALFAGSARALLTSILFAFETTMQPTGLLPLLIGCSSSYLVSGLMMKNTIMTEKIARRGIRIPTEYEADFLDQILVKNCASFSVVTINAKDTIEDIRNWCASGNKDSRHHSYPVVDNNNLIGFVSKHEVLTHSASKAKKVYEIAHPISAVVYPDNTLKEAVNLMAELEIDFFPVVARDDHNKIIAILSRSDILRERKKELGKKIKHRKTKLEKNYTIIK